MSGGQRQRVAIAQALACDPALLVADEPTTALDAVTQAEVLALLARLRERRNLAILLITHNPAVLAGLAARVMVMYAGRIVEAGRMGRGHARPPPSLYARAARLPGRAAGRRAASRPSKARPLARATRARLPLRTPLPRAPAPAPPPRRPPAPSSASSMMPSR